MTEIRQLIQRYRDRQMTLDALADQLANRAYRTPARYAPPPPDMDAEEHALERLGTFPEAGTWEEVEAAQGDGLLTIEEYEVIYERRHRAGGS